VAASVNEPTARLSVRSLCSKWGFGDGDALFVDLSDYWDAVGREYDYAAFDEEALLRLVVRRHLVPAIEAAGHTVEVVDVETIHNPIRAHTIDGVEVDWYEDWDGFDLDVTVSYADIMAAVEESQR
jgi:hypothetical protein